MKLFIALGILSFAVGVVAYMVIAYVLLVREEARETERHVLPFEDMDSEAAVSVCNDRRSRVLSETGHLPPRLPGTEYAPMSVRAAEDCQ